MQGENLFPKEWTTHVIESLGKKPGAFDNDQRMYALAELTAQVMFDGHATSIVPGISKRLFKALNGGLQEWNRDPTTIEIEELSLLTYNYMRIFTRDAESMSEDQLEKLGLAYYDVLANLS